MATKRSTKPPTKKEVRELASTLNDLIHYSKAHLRTTEGRVCSCALHPNWISLNAAIHRAEKFLQERETT
jgi:hypothetical protein